ncbi:MAG: hypothetical protein H6Q48_4740 [Deltaproteobacteria bacterium]|nr:hypothetical protein [Deltaproteobacteria bacterium]
MLRFKHIRLEQDKIDRARKILGARTETEALHKALDKVILEDQTRKQRAKIVKQMVELRGRIGKKAEDSSEWIRAARQERVETYEGSH